jgi:hypothetical protein
MNMDTKIVVANVETPEDIDIETIAERVRSENVSGQVKASAEVHGDAIGEGNFTGI